MVEQQEGLLLISMYGTGITDPDGPERNNWLFTRGFNLGQGTSCRLTYAYFRNSDHFQKNLSVPFRTDTTAAAMTAQLADHPGNFSLHPNPGEHGTLHHSAQRRHRAC